MNGSKNLGFILALCGAAVAAIVVIVLLTSAFSGQPAAFPAAAAATAPSFSAATSASAAPSVSVTPTTQASQTPSDIVGKTTKLRIALYAAGKEPYYQLVCDSLQACADNDPTCHWTIEYKVGNLTDQDQISAVKGFIKAKYDAVVVIQNSVEATAESITLCKAAGVPYFGVCHSFASAPNAKDAAGSCCFNYMEDGYLAGKDAAKHGVKKVLMIEGQLYKNAASDQTYGFLKAYQDAGYNLGGIDALEYATKKNEVQLNGKQDVIVVGWASGGWIQDPAKKAVTDFLSFLGPTGFEGIYVQNDPMMEGVLEALKNAGLDPSKYWLGSCNGRDITWEWVKKGLITMDVSNPPCLEGDTVYQQIKAYFNGQDYKKYVHPPLLAFDESTVSKQAAIPYSDVKAYMKARNENKFTYKLGDPAFTVITEMGA